MKKEIAVPPASGFKENDCFSVKCAFQYFDYDYAHPIYLPVNPNFILLVSVDPFAISRAVVQIQDSTCRARHPLLTHNLAVKCVLYLTALAHNYFSVSGGTR